MGNLFDTLLIHPIINILVAVYQLLLLLQVPYALGFAIIGLTVLIRLLLYPLMATQLKASKKMQDLQPHLTNLKEKHKGDNKKLQEAQMALYKEHGVNPAAGCLPLLIQFPLLIGLYNVLNDVVAKSPEVALQFVNTRVYVDSLKLQTIWDTSFFGIPLGQHPQNIFDMKHLFAATSLILLVPLITAVLQFVQSKMMIPAKTEDPKAPTTTKKKGKALATKEEPKKTDGATEFAQAFQTQSLYIFPIMLGYLSFSFPIGLSLYWNTFTLFGILQQYQVSGWGSFGNLIGKKETK